MGMISRGLKGIDSLINYMTAMGTSKDASSGFNNKYTLNLLDRGTLNTIYRGDWIGKRVVKAPAQDSTRAWRNWQAEQKQIELLEEVEKKFDLQRKLKAALIAARLYGGAGLVIGVNDSVGPEQELNIEKVGKDGLTFVHVMTRYDLKAEPPIDDIMSPWYGEPEFYTVSTAPKTSGGTQLQVMQKIHPSRVIRLIGEELPDAEKTGMGDNWRGDSVLQAVDDVIRATGLVNTGIAGLIHDAKMDIIKIKGFSRMLAEDSSGEYKNSLMARLTVMNNSKSMFNSVAMDAEEEWERTQTNFAALPDLMQKYLSLAAGAADIPMSRLLGQSSSGLGSNAGSENDTRNYYDRISSEQKTVLSPALTVLDEIVIRSALGKDDKSIWYEWAPLWQMTELELATIAKSKADTTAVYVNTGLINEDALRIGVANQLNEDATYPGLDTAIEDEGLEPPAPTGGFDPQTGTPLDPQTGLPVHPAVVKALAGAKKPTHSEMAADATPHTLYVRRDVVNADDIIAHMKAQGFTTTIPADQFHVTIMFSRTPIDWMKVSSDYFGNDAKGQIIVGPGGPRLFEKFGDAVVLLFGCSSLSWRHEEMKRAGATYDFADYQPHITITWNVGDFDWQNAEPYQGKIVLGPEIFEEINDDWKSTITEDAAYTASIGIALNKPKKRRKKKADAP